MDVDFMNFNVYTRISLFFTILICHVIGAMNSVKLLMESTMKSGFIPLYNLVYNHTFESMPSAFFLISIVLTIPLVLIFW